MHICKPSEREEEVMNIFLLFFFFHIFLKSKMTLNYRRNQKTTTKQDQWELFLLTCIKLWEEGKWWCDCLVHLADHSGSEAGLHWETTGPDTTALHATFSRLTQTQSNMAGWAMFTGSTPKHTAPHLNIRGNRICVFKIKKKEKKNTEPSTSL